MEHTLPSSHCFCRFQVSLYQLELVDPFLGFGLTDAGGISKAIIARLVQAPFFPVHFLLFDKEKSRITTRLYHNYCHFFFKGK